MNDAYAEITPFTDAFVPPAKVIAERFLPTVPETGDARAPAFSAQQAPNAWARRVNADDQIAALRPPLPPYESERV